MATLNAKTIGPTGDYATLALWRADCPLNLTTADPTGYVYQARVQNTEIVSAGGQVSITGIAGTDATHYVEITADTGCSFADNANKRTNALRYNAANGAALRNTQDGNIISSTVPYTRVSRLLLSGTKTSGASPVSLEGANSLIDDCIVESLSNLNGSVYLYGSGCKIRNSVVIQKSALTTVNIADISSWASAYNTVFVSLNAVVNSGITSNYGTTTLKNCYVGGCVAPTSGNATIVKTTSATDATASGWTTVPFSTATFENVTDGTHDFRMKSGSSLIGAGTVDATNAPNDITGYPRTSSNDIGAFQSASGGGAHLITIASSQQVNTASPGAISSPIGTDAYIDIPAIRDWETTNLKTGLNGVQVDVRSISTGALIVRKTGQTTHATTAVCRVTDPLMPHATLCEVMVRFADGSMGVWDLMSV